MLWINGLFHKDDLKLNHVSLAFKYSHSNVYVYNHRLSYSHSWGLQNECIRIRIILDEIIFVKKIESIRCLGFNNVYSAFQFLLMLTLRFFFILIATNVQCLMR